jgi:hypothetical protein
MRPNKSSAAIRPRSAVSSVPPHKGRRSDSRKSVPHVIFKLQILELYCSNAKTSNQLFQSHGFSIRSVKESDGVCIEILCNFGTESEETRNMKEQCCATTACYCCRSATRHSRGAGEQRCATQQLAVAIGVPHAIARGRGARGPCATVAGEDPTSVTLTPDTVSRARWTSPTLSLGKTRSPAW